MPLLDVPWLCGLKLGNKRKKPGPTGNVGGDGFNPFWTCGGLANLAIESNWTSNRGIIFFGGDAGLKPWD